MLIYPVSDIHLEMTDKDWTLPDPLPDFDVMVVAGDLIPRMDRGVAWLAERVDCDVVYVAGNHERYGTDIDATIRKAKHRARGTRIHVLDDDVVTLMGTTFIGSTLWTDFALYGDPEWAAATAAEFMNDYRKIRIENYARPLRPSDTLARHIRSRAFIRDEVTRARAAGSKTVVVSHHGIHAQATRPGRERDLISAAYTSDMAKFVSDVGADLWVYGHVHVSDDRNVGGGQTRVISNPKGYGPLGRERPTHSNPRFDSNLVIEI